MAANAILPSVGAGRSENTYYNEGFGNHISEEIAGQALTGGDTSYSFSFTRGLAKYHMGHEQLSSLKEHLE